MDLLGDKVQARNLAIANGVPVIPGATARSVDADAVQVRANLAIR